MVYDGRSWKKDLLRWKKSILKYNTAEHFKKNCEATCIALEKAISYSAFIIRKLIDCRRELSDDADGYSLQVKTYKPIEKITQLTVFYHERSYDWEHFQKKTVNGKDICNWLIHSYIFDFEWNEKEDVVEDFFVTSDLDRNEVLYRVGIKDWIDYIDFIVDDSVVEIRSYYDCRKKIQDHVYTLKMRGSKGLVPSSSFPDDQFLYGITKEEELYIRYKDKEKSGGDES